MNRTDLYIKQDLSIKQAIKLLDQTAKKILIVTENRKILGVVTDGDIRRWILKSGDLMQTVGMIMNQHPITISHKDMEEAKLIMKSKGIEALPIVNQDSEVVDILFWDELFDVKETRGSAIESPIVIMAGGKGTRLYPYTRILPKPLIPIGETPIVERIINKFHEFGCQKFYMTVNYKKEMIKSYFRELDKSYELECIDEEKPLGTGGSLYLLKDKLKTTFFLSNCDILIDADYGDLLRFHHKNNNKITMVTSLKHYTIPYGVINLDEEGYIKKTEEKPEYYYLVNTGMYIIEPDLLELIPENTFYHMTDLIEACIQKGIKVGTYPVSEESWLDMGEVSEMNRMNERLEGR